MRTMWTGSISFGLVNIPVRLYSGTQSHSLEFDMLHKKDLSPIRYAKVCKEEGEEIPYDEIVKGYEYEKGEYVVLSEEDFKKADVKATKTIDILSFADLDEIDPVYFEKPYYLEPDKGGEKAYVLLREALKKANKAGITKFVLRNREHLGLVKAEGDLLLLDQLRFADEIRDPSVLKVPGNIDVSDKEIDLALSLINQLAAPFDPEAYHDDYKAALEQVIEEKAAGREPVAHGEAPKPTKVKDLMSLLKASLEEREGGEKPDKGSGKRKARADEDEGKTARKRPARKKAS